MSLKVWSISAVCVAAATVVVCVVIGCVPIIRTAGYHEIIRAYQAARPVQTGREGNEWKWDVEVPLSTGLRVRVQAPGHLGVARVVYSDESQPRDLYKYKDYSNPQAIRLAGNRLFVYYCETLFHSECWLLDYDLAARTNVGRRRVDPKDVSATDTSASPR